MDKQELITNDLSNICNEENEKLNELKSIIHLKITPSQTEIPFNENEKIPVECLVKIKVDNSENRNITCKLSLAIVLDSSGSMNANGKLISSKEAIIKVL